MQDIIIVLLTVIIMVLMLLMMQLKSSNELLTAQVKSLTKQNEAILNITDDKESSKNEEPNGAEKPNRLEEAKESVGR